MAQVVERTGSLKRAATRAAHVSSADLRQRLVSAFLVIIAASVLLVAGTFEPFENRLTSVRAQLLDRPPTGEVAIVEIDARSLAELNIWPWPRRYHAQAVDRLHSAGAEIIAFDIDFSALSEPSSDRALAEALRRAEPVILPIFQQRASDRPGETTIVKSQPAPIFGAAWVGGVNIFPGADGTVRDYPAATIIGGQIRPSISALLAESDQLGDRTFQPDWSIDADRIPRFSFVDVVKGRVPDEAIAGKRILIGATAIELGDRYIVPRLGNVPGVLIQALAAESLLQGRAITRSGGGVTIVGVALVALFLGAGRFRRFNRTFPPAALATLLLLAIGPVAIQALWPLSIDSAGLLFAALACVALRGVVELRRRIELRNRMDAETSLPNRLALEADLAKANEAAPVLAAAALERFDSIRDAIGIEAANELVSQAAARIGGRIGGPVYRIAPDLLAWFQPVEGDIAAGTRVLEITELFREPVQTREGGVDVRLTVGLDRSPLADGNVAKIERALAAISTARAAGDACHWYRGADPVGRRQLSMMGELRRGMAAGEVTVAYQPKLDLKSGRVTHAEALVRWHHPTDGLIPPDRFIPLAESSGVIKELTEFVMRIAIADCARLNAMGRPMCVAVNISAADIAAPEFAGQVQALLAESDARPCNLALEVTESAIIRSTATAISVLNELRELGIRLSIDDYGTGQSTLSYLKQLPVHELKIDKSFVMALCANSNDEIMVRSTIQLAHELGLQAVAEGVEDEATLFLLKSLGCDYAQGYFVGEPMAFDGLCQVATSSEPLLKAG
jgi:EAL domain-containing protein (putative c-di-GMP-specific phosphodiesterase class I)/CHASE2 domain-containing sensor protein/GGDEF domain-containing protein